MHEGLGGVLSLTAHRGAVLHSARLHLCLFGTVMRAAAYVVPVAVVLGSVAVLAAVLVALLIWRRRRQQKGRANGDLNIELSRTSMGPALNEIQWADLHTGVTIGHGAFGEVFKGQWGATVVAIKVVKAGAATASPSANADFLREAAVLQSIKPHPNVVQYYGVCRDHPPSLYMVLEVRVAERTRDFGERTRGNEQGTWGTNMGLGGSKKGLRGLP